MSAVVFLGAQNATKSLAADASPQTPLGELSAPPNPLAGFKQSTFRGVLISGVEGRGRKERTPK